MAQADVCIVGAGAGGAVAAWALVQQGVNVLLVERGPRFDSKMYGTHAPEWEIDEQPLLGETRKPEHRSYVAAEGAALDPRYEQLRSSTPTWFAGPKRTRRGAFHYDHGIGVGGSTLRDQGEAHRFPAHAFKLKSARGLGEDWPFDYDALARYYDRVERLIGVAGVPGNPFKPERGSFPYPAHPMSPASKLLAQGARKLGWSQLQNTLAILPARWRGRQACHYCNGCTRGCMVRAKGSVDVSVLPQAERSGRLRIETNVQVQRLEHDEKGRVTALLVSDARGMERRIEARAFVLAAGAIATPRLLLNSKSALFPNGIGNAADQVGRHLMETLYVVRTVQLPRPLNAHHGVPIDSRIWDMNTGAGIVLGQVAGIFEGPVGAALEGAPGFGADQQRRVRERFGGLLEMFGIAEQLPRPENRVTLAEETDPLGVPLARVETTLDEGDLEQLVRTREAISRWIEASSAIPIGQITAFDEPKAGHVAGTCRMGRDPERSVVDPDGRVHGVPNLVIVDASTLPTQGAGDSPSLTIQAVALRAAEALAERGRKLES